MKPIEAHKDENRINVKANLTLKQKHMRKYHKLSVGDMVNIYKKGKGNYSTRKETIPKWSDRKFKLENISF